MFFARKSPSRKRRVSRRFGVEPLERRELLSINLSGTELQILGTATSDTASVWTAPYLIYAELNGVRQSWLISSVASVYFSGYEGGDTFTNYTNLPTTASGGAGNDRITSGTGNDTIYGGNGDDHLYGGSGADQFEGGSGSDTLVSIDAAATDTLFGGANSDSFWTDDSDTISDATASESATNVHRVRSFANGADRTLDGDRIADPTDGTEYKNFADRPLFAAAGPTANDIDQGSLGDCWLLASMGAMAQANPNAVRQTVVDLGDGTYAVRLGGSSYYRVDADLPTRIATSWTPVYGGLGVDNSLWAAVVEKAFADYRTGANTYASLASGPGTEGLRGVNGQSVDWKAYDEYGSAQGLVNDIASKFDSGRAVVCVIGTVGGGAPLIGNHAYTVVGVNRNAAGTVVSVILRNPHGPAGPASVTVTRAQLYACVGDVSWGSVA